MIEYLLRKLDRMIERSWQRHADRLFKQGEQWEKDQSQDQ